MVRQSVVGGAGKQTSITRLILFIFVVILGLALIADYLWASSSRFTSYYFNIAADGSHRDSVILPPHKVRF